MPFDYNSFLQGVQTGLRLGRTSPGRMPPMPSGRYILTEGGIPVISEKYISSDATIYETNEWRQYLPGQPWYPYYYIVPLTGLNYLYAHFTDAASDGLYVVTWRYEDVRSFGQWDIYGSANPPSSMFRLNSLYFGGAIIRSSKLSIGLTPDEDMINDYLPASPDTIMFAGSLFNDLPNFLLGLQRLKMITEGG